MIYQHPAAMFRGLIRAATIVALTVATAVSAQDMTEGRNYARIKNPQPVETGKNIEVIEFFSYGCPHCGELEPNLQAWLKNKPADVQLRRVPVMFQPRWESLARVYYTLEAMGEESKLSPDVFTAIHGKGAQLWNDKEFFDWAASKGLDRKKVEDLYNSFTVVGKVNRAKQQAGVYQIQSVPTIIVDGKFVTGPERMANGHAGIPGAIDALVVKARADRPKS
ncbi:MAG: thiol:disulfide interchange protein DsbA/DsbL [Betaproteobacteria bacterium]